MVIKIKILHEDTEIAQAQFEKAKLVKGGVLLPVELDNKNQGKIPENLPSDFVVLIEESESGGGLTNTGYARIICDISGKALKPFYIPKGYANGDHAFFAQPCIVTVDAWRKSQEIEILRHETSVEKGVITLITTPVWGGRFGELPDCFEQFGDAVTAAYDKCNCYHCRSAHFIKK